MLNRILQRVGLTPSSTDSGTDDCCPASTTLHQTLRHWGEGAFGTDVLSAKEIRQQCFSWAETLARRTTDWEGLAGFVAGLRKAEHLYVTHSLAALRRCAWTFLKSTSQMLAHDEKESLQMERELGALRQAFESGSAGEVRKAVETTLTLFEKIVIKGRERRALFSEKVGAAVHEVSNALVRERGQFTTDATTHLFDKAALAEHMERVACIAPFMGQKASHILITFPGLASPDLDADERDALLCRLADICVRTFLRRQDFVARSGHHEISVVAEGRPLAEARTVILDLAKELRMALPPHEGKEVLWIVSEVLQGESGQNWMERTRNGG